eukprot:scaffold13108_cov83-Skeletonema_dohrnii-CCMP3373.AAC.1
MDTKQSSQLNQEEEQTMQCLDVALQMMIGALNDALNIKLETSATPHQVIQTHSLVKPLLHETPSPTRVLRPVHMVTCSHPQMSIQLTIKPHYH